MSMNDTISDFITHIRNACLAKHELVRVPSSSVKKEIARILKEEGYIQEWIEEKEGTRKVIVIKLKYDNRCSVIIRIKRDSKPGRRKYVSKEKIYSVANGYGTLVLSTSKGIMTGYQAQKMGIGGEPLIQIW